MNEWDVFRPQEPAQHEEPKATEAEQGGEVNEAKGGDTHLERAASPRIAALMAQRDEAEQRLQKALLDLETREQSPAYRQAKKSFDSGLRLYARTYHGEDELWLVPVEAWKRGTDEVKENAALYLFYTEEPLGGETLGKPGSELYRRLNIEDRLDKHEVLKHLWHLTQE